MIDYQPIVKKVSSIAIQVAIMLFVFLLMSTALDIWRAQQLPQGTLPVGSYTTLNEQVINFHDLEHYAADELVVVYFWATWCGPCKVTSPSVKQLAKHHPVVSIAMASGDDKVLEQYVSSSGLNIPVINDDNQAIANTWGVKVTPTVLFIKGGQIHGYTMGASGYPGLLARAWWLAKG
ncbi:thioredoxin domain-containing protein [Marinagarivorans algicola]|uniref:thioredoxin domain-containing protein n=1 Tax=Marinagarivorans algicola TaxID=1513270 RepID=UPI0006B45726|nr:thioredoxin domain-containing protein [Marinagarivorans algicola]